MKKKVLYIGMSDNLGGIESFIISTYRNIDRQKVQIDFLKFSDELCFEDELIKGGSNIYQLPARGLKFFRHYYALIRFFRKHKEYDVVHYHLNTASCIAALVVSKSFGITTVAHSHNAFKGNRFVSSFFHKLNKHILPLFTDKYIACSLKAGNDMFGEKNYTIVKNGIETFKFAYNKKLRTQIRSSLGVNNERLYGNIGALKYQKNHTFLLDVFKRISINDSEAKLILVGDGVLKEQLKEKATSFKIDDKVLFVGVRQDISDLLIAMDAFIFPSHYEGLPISVVEAQASGLQCFVSDRITDEVILSDSCHALSLDKSAEEWADYINANFSEKRKDNVEIIKAKGFDAKQTALELEKLYLKSVNEDD